MEKYKNIKEKVKQIEYKLGVSYAKTDGKIYKWLWGLELLCVIYLFGLNSLTLLSAYLRQVHVNQRYFTTLTFILLIAGTLLEIGGIILNKVGFHIIGNILNIIPLPYFVCVFAPMLTHPDGFMGYRSEFYFRYFISYVLILLFSLIMIFIALRQRLKTRKLYNRVLDNIYEEYKKKNTSDDFSTSEEDWDNYIRNFDPRNKKLKKDK